MNMPTATYRIQFNPAFGFQAAQTIIAYLADLGISDLYALHIQSRKGSTHGYDVVDPNHLNPELGGLSDLEGLAAELKRPPGVDQDIVPNHMAMDSDNRLLMDILENGSSSRYFQFLTWIGITRPPASTREFWPHFLAGSMGNVSKWRDHPPIRS